MGRTSNKLNTSEGVEVTLDRGARSVKRTGVSKNRKDSRSDQRRWEAIGASREVTSIRRLREMPGFGALVREIQNMPGLGTSTTASNQDLSDLSESSEEDYQSKQVSVAQATGVVRKDHRGKRHQPEYSSDEENPPEQVSAAQAAGVVRKGHRGKRSSKPGQRKRQATKYQKLCSGELGLPREPPSGFSGHWNPRVSELLEGQGSDGIDKLWDFAQQYYGRFYALEEREKELAGREREEDRKGKTAGRVERKITWDKFKRDRQQEQREKGLRARENFVEGREKEAERKDRKADEKLADADKKLKDMREMETRSMELARTLEKQMETRKREMGKEEDRLKTEKERTQKDQEENARLKKRLLEMKRAYEESHRQESSTEDSGREEERRAQGCPLRKSRARSRQETNSRKRSKGPTRERDR